LCNSRPGLPNEKTIKPPPSLKKVSFPKFIIFTFATEFFLALSSVFLPREPSSATKAIAFFI
jgi:hypothetical protein